MHKGMRLLAANSQPGYGSEYSEVSNGNAAVLSMTKAAPLGLLATARQFFSALGGLILKRRKPKPSKRRSAFDYDALLP